MVFRVSAHHSPFRPHLSDFVEATLFFSAAICFLVPITAAIMFGEDKGAPTAETIVIDGIPETGKKAGTGE